MMKSQRLLNTAFDIDGVVCHTWKTIIEILNEEGYAVTEGDLTKFDIRDCLDITREEFNKVIAKVLSRECMNRKPIEDKAIWCLRNLHRLTGKTIPFITSRKDPENTMYYLENYIVKRQFPYIVRHGSWDDGLTAWDRKLAQIKNLECIAMVEDAPETLQVLSQHGIIPILIDRPYNKYCTWALRVTDWKVIFNLALALEGNYGRLIRGQRF
jgi:uncharacterized HAD superfamily protein